VALSFNGYELHITLIDSGGDTATLSYKMDSADYTALVTDAGTIRAALQTITNAVVKGYSLVSRYVETALVLPTNAEIEKRATVVAQIAANPLKKATIQIPAPADSIFVGVPGSGENYNIVDGADADLLDYLGIWSASGGVANISDGEYLDATSPFVRGKRTTRGSSNG